MTSTTDQFVTAQEADVQPLTAIVADFAARLSPSQLPENVVAAARRHVLDILGISAAASAQPFGRRFRRLSLPQPGQGGATALGLEQPCTAEDAAFVNGVLAHGLDFDDTYQPGIVHIGAVVIPTALAVGEVNGRSSEDILAGVVLGYEIASRLAEASPGAFHRIGFHATPICGAFAAALVAARLTGLDAQTTMHALGIAGSFAAGIQEFLRDGSDTKRLHPGWAALSGIRAAQFAGIGFGGPQRVWEGHYGLFATHVGLDAFDPARVVEGLGSRWNILGVSVKPYPCCHLLHAHVDAARRLRATGVDPQTIRRIRASIHEAGLHLLAEPEDEKRRPSSTYGAQFSLPFAVASAFVEDEINLRSFGPDRLADPELRRLADLTECVVDPRSRYPRYFDGAVEVWLDDGSHIEQREDVNRGSPERPLDDGELAHKFVRNLDVAGVAAPQAEAIARAIADQGELPGVLTDLNQLLTTNRT